MANLTTLNEATRTVDGTESIRLATTGANWKALLSSIFSTLGRERLTAARTYYVRTDGNDSNTGLVNTAGGAFLTLQKAWNTVAYGLDLNGNTATIQMADGTYAGSVALGDGPIGSATSTSVIIQGNTSDNSLVVLSSGINCGYGNIQGQMQVYIRKLKLTNASGDGLNTSGCGVTFDDINFGTCSGSHISAQHQAFVGCTTSYSVSGGAQFHAVSATSSTVALHAPVITFSNTPTFSVFFLDAQADSTIYIGSVTFTNGGTVTNTLGKALVLSGGYVDIGGASNGAAYLPGTGTVSLQGGQYGGRQRSQFGDTAYAMIYGDDFIAQVATLTAARTVTLIPVANMCPGQKVIVADESGSATALLKIVVAAQAGEFIGVPGVGFVGSVDSVTQACGSAEFSCNGSTWTKLR